MEAAAATSTQGERFTSLELRAWRGLLRVQVSLVKTLDAYFACLGSPTEAAERLHVHRNTLLYRLHRIQEIALIDLSDAETRLALHLSLRVSDVLKAGRPATGV